MKLTSPKSNIMTLKKFARRFSSSDWTFLCSNARFESACDKKDFALAEVIADEILNPQPVSESTSDAPIPSVEEMLKMFGGN
jgi:hypothetical protein